MPSKAENGGFRITLCFPNVTRWLFTSDQLKLLQDIYLLCFLGVEEKEAEEGREDEREKG